MYFPFQSTVVWKALIGSHSALSSSSSRIKFSPFAGAMRIRLEARAPLNQHKLQARPDSLHGWTFTNRLSYPRMDATSLMMSWKGWSRVGIWSGNFQTTCRRQPGGSVLARKVIWVNRIGHILSRFTLHSSPNLFPTRIRHQLEAIISKTKLQLGNSKGSLKTSAQCQRSSLSPQTP